MAGMSALDALLASAPQAGPAAAGPPQGGGSALDALLAPPQQPPAGGPPPQPGAPPQQHSGFGNWLAGINHALDSFGDGFMNGSGLGAVRSLVGNGAVSLVSQFGNHPMSLAQAAAMANARQNQEANNYPFAYALGTGAGIIGAATGAGKIGQAAVDLGVPGAARVMAAVTPAADAGVVTRGLQMGAAGALGGAATEAAQNGAVDDRTLIAAGLGGVAGPVAGTVLGQGAKLAGRGLKAFTQAISPEAGATASAASDQAMRALAKVIQNNPDKLQAAAADAARNGGGTPMLLTILDGPGAAKLNMLAKNNPQLADNLQRVRDAYQAALPAQVSSKVGQAAAAGVPPGFNTLPQPVQDIIRLPGEGIGGTQTMGQIQAAQKAMTDAASQAGAWETTRVPLTPDDLPLMTDLGVRNAVNSAASNTSSGLALRNRYNKMVEDLMPQGPNGSGGSGLDVSHRLTIADLDNIRQLVKTAGENRANVSSHIGNDLGDIAGQIGQLGESINSNYAEAMANHRMVGDYMRGFDHGTTGQIPQLAEGDLRKALATPQGAAGYRQGLAATVAKNAMSTEGGAANVADQLSQKAGLSQAVGQAMPAQAPGLKNYGQTVTNALETMRGAVPNRIEQNDHAAQQAQQSITGFLSGLIHAGQYHAARALGEVVGTNKLSDKAVSGLTQMLTTTDPKQQAAAFAVLKKMGVDNRALGQLQNFIALSAGVRAGATTFPARNPNAPF